MPLLQCFEGVTGAIHVGPVLTPLRWLSIQSFFGSKWFLQALGHEGLNNLLMAYEDKSAQAVCTFAYCEGPEHNPIIFEGRITVGFK